MLFFVLFLNIEQSRLEARIGLAYRTVCQIAESDGVDDTSAPSANETDPWGQSYRITKSTQGLIAASNGPNQITLATGYDRDDIYSDMTNSPTETILRNKRWQMLAALLMPAIWLIGTGIYLKLAVQHNAPLSQSAG